MLQISVGLIEIVSCYLTLDSLMVVFVQAEGITGLSRHVERPESSRNPGRTIIYNSRQLARRYFCNASSSGNSTAAGGKLTPTRRATVAARDAGPTLRV